MSASEIPGKRRPMEPGWALGIGIIAILFIYLVWVALRIRIDYYDAFEVLLNSRAIATGGGVAWNVIRPIGLPAALAPYFLIERFGGGENFAWAASHLTAVILWLALLLFSYKLFRPRLGEAWALVACVLLAITPLLLHYAVAVKEDVAAAALVAAAFWAYQKAATDARRLLPAAIFIALACAFRYNLIPSLAATIALNEILACQWNPAGIKRLGIRCLILGGLSAGIFLAMAIFVYGIIGRASPIGTPRMLYLDMLRSKRAIDIWVQPASVNAWFILKVVTWPIFLCAIFGIARAAHKRFAGAALHGIWLVCFLSVQTFLIGNKEARYLFPALISLYFFAALGIQGVWQCLPRGAVRPLAVGLLMAWPVWLAIVECGNFADPIYRSDIEQQVGQYAAQTAGKHRIIWDGWLYALHPADYRWDENDAFAYVYHLGPPAVAYFGKHEVINAMRMPELPGPDEGVVMVNAGVAPSLQSGDVLIVCREADSYETRNMPTALRPLTVQRLEIHEFDRPADAGSRYLCSQWPTATIEATPQADGWRIDCRGVPSGVYILYAESANPPPLLLGIIPGGHDGQMTVPFAFIPRNEVARRFVLYEYDKVKSFSPPQ